MIIYLENIRQATENDLNQKEISAYKWLSDKLRRFISFLINQQ